VSGIKQHGPSRLAGYGQMKRAQTIMAGVSNPPTQEQWDGLTCEQRADVLQATNPEGRRRLDAMDHMRYQREEAARRNQDSEARTFVVVHTTEKAVTSIVDQT